MEKDSDRKKKALSKDSKEISTINKEIRQHLCRKNIVRVYVWELYRCEVLNIP